jgi:hypothetical protein
VTAALVKGLALGRIGVGVAMLLQPEAALNGWIGTRAASNGGSHVLARAFGARDLSLGAGTLAALASGRDARDWVAAGAFADVADLVATTRGEDIPVSGKLLVAALASSAIAVSAAYLAGANES